MQDLDFTFQLDVLGRQPPVFKGATCKGSYVLGTACGKCERCWWEFKAIEAELGRDLAIALPENYEAL